jgi:hypothetical protein
MTVTAAFKDAQDIGDTNPITVSHGLSLANKEDLVVHLYDNSTSGGGAQIVADIVPLNLTQIQVTFAVAPASNSIRCVMVG